MEEAMLKVPESWIVQGDLNLNPVIAPCSKSCRSRIALRRLLWWRYHGNGRTLCC